MEKTALPPLHRLCTSVKNSAVRPGVCLSLQPLVFCNSWFPHIFKRRTRRSLVVCSQLGKGWVTRTAASRSSLGVGGGAGCRRADAALRSLLPLGVCAGGRQEGVQPQGCGISIFHPWAPRPFLVSPPWEVQRNAETPHSPRALPQAALKGGRVLAWVSSAAQGHSRLPAGPAGVSAPLPWSSASPPAVSIDQKSLQLSELVDRTLSYFPTFPMDRYMLFFYFSSKKKTCFAGGRRKRSMFALGCPTGWH